MLLHVVLYVCLFASYTVCALSVLAFIGDFRLLVAGVRDPAFIGT